MPMLPRVTSDLSRGGRCRSASSNRIDTRRRRQGRRSGRKSSTAGVRGFACGGVPLDPRNRGHYSANSFKCKGLLTMPDGGSAALNVSDERRASRFLDPALDRLAIRPGEPVSRADLARWYRAMKLARTFEEKLAALYRQGRIVGAVYLGMGQEAISTGVVSLLRKDDYFSTVARGLAGWFLRGAEPRDVFARWFGKDVPPSHGRELGLFVPDLPNFGIAPYHNGSMASWIPAGAGFALAFKYRHQ